MGRGPFQNVVFLFLITECTKFAKFYSESCRNWSELKTWNLEIDPVMWDLQSLGCTIAELSLNNGRKAAQKGHCQPTELIKKNPLEGKPL